MCFIQKIQCHQKGIILENGILEEEYRSAKIVLHIKISAAARSIKITYFNREPADQVNIFSLKKFLSQMNYLTRYILINSKEIFFTIKNYYWFRIKIRRFKEF